MTETGRTGSVSESALTPRDATVAKLPDAAVRKANIEMAHSILDAYQMGDDRSLVIGWSTRLATHLLALEATVGEPRGKATTSSPALAPEEVVAALRYVLSRGRGTSGRIILERHEEEKARTVLALHTSTGGGRRED